jgi:20S proteasome alpha/beta subunit
MNEPPLVRIAANCVRRLIYQYRDEFLAGMIVAGWDKKLGGQVCLNQTKACQLFSLHYFSGLFLSTWRFTCSTTGFTWWFRQYLYLGLSRQ